MPKHNQLCPRNERIKRRYFVYLKEAMGYSEDSVDGAAAAIARFEQHTGYRDFNTFNQQQAISFKRSLAQQRNQRTGKPLSKTTLKTTSMYLRRFFHWLADQSGYKSKLSYTDSDYFNLSANDTRIASARRTRPSPSLEQVRHVIHSMPATTDVEMRDRAVIAFTILTGARDGATASAKLKHISLEGGYFKQDARDVKTKHRKTFITYFYAAGTDVLQIFVDWVLHLRAGLSFGDDDPLFPKTVGSPDKGDRFGRNTLGRDHWTGANSIRRIFRSAFEAAGEPYYAPHSLRATIARLGIERCRTTADSKAWSQNMGHSNVATTFGYYGEMPVRQQREHMRRLEAIGDDGADLQSIATDELMRELQRRVGN